MLQTSTLVFIAFSCVFLEVNAGKGCNIENGNCICGERSDLVYRFPTKVDCMKMMKGESWDICQNNPCRHGSCSQTSIEPGYRCRCEGTGYFGQRCHRACPKLGSRITGEYPYACIVI